MKSQDRSILARTAARPGPHGGSYGATVLETVVVLAIIVLFAGIVAPEVKNYYVRGKAARICAVYQMVSKGAMEYWADTGHYAYEDSSSSDEASHQLFYKPSPHLAGWSGAYTNHPLSESDNPFKARVVLSHDLDAFSKFDLDGNGVAEIGGNGLADLPTDAGDGNALAFDLASGTAPDDPIIQKVEETLEKDGVIDPNRGRVIVDANGRKLVLFIFKMP